jgi:thiamine biosynthesis lipoprotein
MTVAAPALPKRAFVEQVMGLPVSVLLRGPGAEAPYVSRKVAAFFSELRQVDAVFSTYRDDSEISRLDRGELTLGACAPEVREVLALCDRAQALTEGLFDARAGGHLDPSGLVKGWAVERAARLLPRDDVDICVNAGGDVLTTCLVGREPWRIGIEDPHDRTGVLATVELRNGAVATSGTAARGAHLLDPRDGTAAASIASVSVRGPSLMVADVLATAAFVRGREALDEVARHDGYAGLVVHLDRTIRASPSWAVASSSSRSWT